MKVLLLDIEGTTTSISFVYDVLFPFAKKALEATFTGSGLLVDRWADDAIQDAVARLGGGAGKHSPIAAAAAALALMHADVKDTGLKILQGLIWQVGYERGEIRGHVYADVPAAFEQAIAAGLRVAIYSSGSVQAQRLIFGYSEAGDLGRFISGYFDTTTGPKKEAASYTAIAAALGVEARAVTFGSDNLDEVRAAIAAGMQAVVAVRPGNPPLPSDHGLPAFTTLAELALPLPLR